MTIEWPTVIEGGIPLVGGIYATALGFGWLGRSGPSSARTEKLLVHMRWLGPLVALFGVFMGWQSHSRLAHPGAAEIASGISKRIQLPKRIDEITTLNAVTGSGDTIIYRHSVAATLENDEERSRVERAFKEVMDSYCGNADAAKLLSSGYTIEWRYRFEGSSGELSTAIDAESCSH